MSIGIRLLHVKWYCSTHYNFVRIHGSLRVTPTIAAGVADRVWALQELLA